MTATTVLPPEAAAYLAEVREALGDLPPAERDDLLVEVEASLAETASEGEGPLAARLGPPLEFATELRAAAGLHEPPAPGIPGSRLRESAARVIAAPALVGVRRLAGELAPIGWALRGYVIVAAIALLAGARWSRTVVPRVESGELGVAVVCTAIAASVGLGLWSRRRGSGWLLLAVGNLAVAGAAIPVVLHLAERPTISAAGPAVVVEAPPGLAYNGVPIDNVYPYSRDGRLLHDVLLFDGAGRPLDVRPGAVDPLRRVVRTRNGPIFNAFPIRYFARGTKRVAHPNAAPRARVARVVTPPLRIRQQRR